MNIALIMGEVAYVSNSKIIAGICDQAIRDGNHVFLFTSEGWKYDNYTDYKQGEYQIYTLPDFGEFDGAIVSLDTVHEPNVVKDLTEKLEQSNIPCVSLNLELKNSSMIMVQNELGIRRMVEHVVTVHHAKSIHYISGPKHNRDARIRLTAFHNEMERFEIPYDVECIHFGDFDFQSGKRIIKEYIKEGRKFPDAFIAANDHMAIGAASELQKAGIRVPEDVIVTGFDGSDLAESYIPEITTVQRQEYEVGAKAYAELLSLIRKESTPKRIIFPGRMHYTSSCGCEDSCKEKEVRVISNHIEKQIFSDIQMEMMKCAKVEFSNIFTFPELWEGIRGYVERLELDFFAIAFVIDEGMYVQEIGLSSEKQKIERDITAYTEQLHIPLAYENGEWTRYEKVCKNHILPEKYWEASEGMYYIVMPIHKGTVCWGYCVIGTKSELIDGRFIQHFVLNIDNALGIIQNHDMLNMMLKKMNEKWIYDALTNVYNRSGLWNGIDTLLKIAPSEGMLFSVVFLDLDGLKKVNDVYGHEIGDAYICDLADLLKKNKKKDEMIVRYGGDEFLVVFHNQDEGTILSYVAMLKDRIMRRECEKKEYRLSASIGYESAVCKNEAEFMELIDRADQNMYEEKKRKKMNI